MLLDDAAWVEVRRLYAESTMSVRLLAHRFGASPRTITNRAKKEGWPARPPDAPPLGRRKQKAKPRARADTTQTSNTKPEPPPAPVVAETAPAPAGLTDDAPKRAPPRSPAPASELPSRKDQKALIARLYRAISSKLEQMETRMANGEQRSAQDEERETRALSTMIRNFEKVTEAVSDFDRAKKPAAGEPTARADAERMRREITERLERLHGQRDTKRDPGGA